MTCRCAAVAAARHDPPVAPRLIYLLLTKFLGWIVLPARFDSKEIEILVLRLWVPETPFTAANASQTARGWCTLAGALALRAHRDAPIRRS